MNPIIVRVRQGESIESISHLYNIPKEIIIKANEIDKVEEGDRLVIPFMARAIHRVKPLENLNSIAKLYDTTSEKIKLDNNLTAPLFLGQELIIF